MAEHNLDDYTYLNDTKNNSKTKFTKIILLFSFFLIFILFLKFIITYNYNIASNLELLTNNFTKIENNKLITLNQELDLNTNLYVLELYRFGHDSCQFRGYNKNDFLLAFELNKMSQLQEHVIYFNNDIYINNLFKTQSKEDVLISINYCLQKINSDIDNKQKIDNSWK